MIIKPKILKGFRDSLPEQEMVKRDIFSILEKTFRSHGLVPIDTPVLEYRDILLGKGGGETDKQVYAFQDNGKRDVAMRFDLTVPFARYMSMYSGQLGLPFKRYHMAKVWRGENTQKGRYREFYQCDFDIVGIDSASADLEILILIINSFRNMGIKDFTIKISHRGLFNLLLTNLGIEDSSVQILRIVDKLPKIGIEKTREMLCDLIPEDAAEKIITFITSNTSINEAQQLLSILTALVGGENDASERLKDILTSLKQAKLDSYIIIDPSITRGLDYYTGLVYETFLNALPGIGSVCSGGRYNNLAGLYTKEHLPGVGASIGLDRLLAALSDPALQSSQKKEEISTADFLIMNMDEKLSGYYTTIAQHLRTEGYSAETYLTKKKIGQQFKYADKKHIPYAVIAGEDEYEKNTVNIKNLQSFKEMKGVSLTDGISAIRKGEL